RRSYNQATATFRIEPAMRMSWLARRIDAGMVVEWARDRRAELLRLTGLSRAHKVVYLYVGRYGQSDLPWPRVEPLPARGIRPITNMALPAAAPDNLHAVPSALWPGGDLIASSDAVLAKAGYGTACAAMASGTPMIYPPRWGFAEFRSLDQALRAWPGGIPVSSRDFGSFKLERALDRALQAKPGPPPLATDGASRVARYLAAICLPRRSRKVTALAF